MDKLFVSNGVLYRWNEEKARANIQWHGIDFKTATQVFQDKQLQFQDATVDDEPREVAIGFTFKRRLLYVVNVELSDDSIRIISAREATARERMAYEDRT